MREIFVFLPDSPQCAEQIYFTPCESLPAKKSHQQVLVRVSCACLGVILLEIYGLGKDNFVWAELINLPVAFHF